MSGRVEASRVMSVQAVVGALRLGIGGDVDRGWGGRTGGGGVGYR